MEDINLMREYVRLVECRNFTLVAKEFYLSQPTVTKHVQRLEREFGCTLVERDTHTVSITEAGLALYDGFKQLIADYDRMVMGIDRINRGKNGSLRLGVLYHGIAELVMPLVSNYSAKYPNTEIPFVSCQGHEAYRALREGDLDVAVVCESDSQEGIDFVPTKEVELFCVVGKESPLWQRDTVTGDDLVNLDWVYLLNNISLGMIEDLHLPYGRLVGEGNIDALPLSLANPQTFTVLDECLDGKLGKTLRFIPFGCPVKHGLYGVACRSDDERPLVWDFMESCSSPGLSAGA